MFRWRHQHLLLEYFESIKHAYVNFVSGTVDYRPPHYPEPQLSAWQFSENLLYSIIIIIIIMTAYDITENRVR